MTRRSPPLRASDPGRELRSDCAPRRRRTATRSAQRRPLQFEPLEARTLLAAYPTYDGPAIEPPPPAPTPIGSQATNCGSSFFAPAPDSPGSTHPPPVAAPPQPAGGPPLEIFVTVTADEDDGDRTPMDISLREAILIANAGNADATIHVPAGTYTLTRPGRGENTGSLGDLDVSNPGHLTRILGADRATTIVRNGEDDRVFHVHGGSTVEIRGLSIENGLELHGGGVYNAGNLTLVDVAVRQNVGSRTGGGVANAPGATLAIDQSTIANNTAQYGGGAINNLNGSLTITNSTLSDNFAFSGGGVLNQGGTLTLTSSTLSANNASESGGGLVNLSVATAATANLNGTSVTGNRVTNLMQNTSLAQGGGICNAADGPSATATVSIAGGSVSNNRATAGNLEQVTDSAAQGGGIYNRASGSGARATVTVADATLSANLATATATTTASATGGGVHNRAENNDARAVFSASDGNSVGNGVSSLVLGGETMIDPVSTALGGAFYNRARMDNAIATMSLASMNINGNTVVSNAVMLADGIAAGGGIYNEAGVVSASAPSAQANLSVIGGGLQSNTVDANDGGEVNALGAAIANVGDYGHTAVDVSDLLASDNHASGDSDDTVSALGGAIYNRVNPLSTLSRLSILRTTVRGNRLDAAGGMAFASRGGGLYSDGIAVTVRDSTFSGNDAGDAGNGGGIYARRTLDVVNSTLSGNEARAGGGLYVHSGTATLFNATVADNSVTLGGGGVMADVGANVTLLNTLVAKNLLLVVNGSPSPNDVSGAFNVTSSYNWIGSGTGSTGIVDGASGNRVGVVGKPLEPFIGPLANNGGFTETHLLFPISPLIDAGQPQFDPNGFVPALTMDQRRESRVLDGNRDSVARVDIGAVEVRSTLFADLDGDGRVGLADLMVLHRHYLVGGTWTYAEGDLNGDTVVDRTDLAMLVDHWGSAFAPLSPAAPSSLSARASAKVDAAVGASREQPAVLRAAPRRAARPHRQAVRLDATAVDRALASPTENLSASRTLRRR